MARPVLNHRGPEFRKILSRCEELIQPVLGTRNRVFFFACSGTGMMEAALVNVLAPGERVLVCIHGQFGERFASIALAIGVNVDRLEFDWGRPIDPAAVEARLKTGEYRAVVVVHNESSTAVTSDLAAIGKIAGDTLLVVDSVSGLGGLEMRQDEWGVDVVVSSSQKALMCPPGIGIASVSERAWKIVNRDSGMPRFYWDFRKARASMEVPETPFTSPVSLMTGLCEALEMIRSEGLAEVLDRHRRLSSMLREGCARLGLRTFGDGSSPTVVAVEVENGGEIVKAMYERFSTVIAGSRNKLKGRVIRIGTMGSVSEADIVLDLHYLGRVLSDLKIR